MKSVKQIIYFLLTLLIFNCADQIVKPPDTNKNMEDFEALWNRVNDVYPFLEFKQIDWDSIYTVYRPRIEAARGDEFYLVLNDLLAELKDGHVYYHTDGGGEVYPYYPQRYFKDRHAYSPFVVRSYFSSELIVTESKSVEYRILPHNIGYVFLSDFHENYLVNEFPVVMEYVRYTRGLIIDIRQRRGGSSQNVEAVVSRFVDSPMEWPRLYFLGQLVPSNPIQPGGSFTYTNPVVVLINGSTFSAGELCTEILKQLPGVTVVGDTTGGGGGAGSNGTIQTNSDYELPSGKLISVPTGYFERYDGEVFEWLGVPPDIRVVQTKDDIKAGRDKQLEYAIDMLR
jgi:hypothetical protein